MPRSRPMLAAFALIALAAPLSAQEVRSGAFTGQSNHQTDGTGQIVIQDGAATVRLAEDFAFDGAPDPKVALGRDGYDASTILGPLRSDYGGQDYAIPEGIDASAYNEIWIWCERFDVPLGVARLE